MADNKGYEKDDAIKAEKEDKVIDYDSQKLKQNGTGEAEYNFICDYYNRQDFPGYHTQN
jgi:hypothetical protein